MNKEEAKRIFGINLRKIRMAKGISQEELSLKLGYSSRSSINKIESGERDMPRSKVELAAKILGVSPLDLFKNEIVTEFVVVDDDISSIIDLEKLNEKNRAKLEAYYQALIDSQEDE